jgi:hypothetical protein
LSRSTKEGSPEEVEKAHGYRRLEDVSTPRQLVLINKGRRKLYKACMAGQMNEAGASTEEYN